jgi:DNA-binding response OmpR family regulator/DnaJ-domain-containing protein 1
MPRTVLIVDDDREVQKYLTEALEAQGWRVICEKDGDWAVKTFHSRNIDAVILDILIPAGNGFKVAEAIRKHPRGQHVGIIMLTGIYRGASHRAEAIRRYELLDYLDKPVESARVLDVLRQHFEKLVPPVMLTPAVIPLTKPRSDSRFADAAQRREKREVERAAAQQLSEGDATVRGNLKRVAFPRLLHQLYQRRATGALFLLREKIKKIVYFKDGHPTYIKSNLLGECLGRVLVRERMITPAECEESLTRMKAGKRQQGTVLIEMGVISPHNLKYALELQLQIKLYDIFTWRDGEYQFKEDAKLPNEVVGLDLPNGAIILEGIRRAYDAARLESFLSPFMSAFIAPAEDPAVRLQDMPLEDEERALLDAVDGTRTVKEHLASAGMSDLRAQILLYAFLCTGVVEPVETAVREPRPLLTTPRASSADSGAFPAGPTRPGAPRTLVEEPAGRERLAANLLSLRQQDHFEVLGVARAATPLEIEQAYEDRARDYHPDRFRDRSEDTRTISAEIFARLGEAHRVLTDGRQRAEYLDGLERGENEPLPADSASRALAADKHFRSGEELLKRRRFDEAEAAFRKACELIPEAGEYHAFLGWVIFQGSPEHPLLQQQAQEELHRGVELSPRVDRTHLFFGYFLSQIGKIAQAEHEFELAIQCNPDCSEALRELRLINARRTQRGMGLDGPKS